MADGKLGSAAAVADLSRHRWKPDYVEILRRGDLAPMGDGDRERVVLGAARLGAPRLIDSLEF